MKNSLLFIETRRFNGLKEILEDHRKFIPDSWDCKVVCSKDNKDLFEGYDLEIVPSFRNVNEYNHYLTSVYFWERFLEYDRVLFTERESMILRHGIEYFLDWDYVGAPWKPYAPWGRTDRKGGNGGFSLRNPRSCYNLCKSIKYSPVMGNCDVYFVQNLDNVMAKIAPFEVCKLFSCETIFELGTLGYHAIDKHLTPQQCSKIKNQYKKC